MCAERDKFYEEQQQKIEELSVDSDDSEVAQPILQMPEFSLNMAKYPEVAPVVYYYYYYYYCYYYYFSYNYNYNYNYN